MKRRLAFRTFLEKREGDSLKELTLEQIRIDKVNI